MFSSRSMFSIFSTLSGVALALALAAAPGCAEEEDCPPRPLDTCEMNIIDFQDDLCVGYCSEWVDCFALHDELVAYWEDGGDVCMNDREMEFAEYFFEEAEEYGCNMIVTGALGIDGRSTMCWKDSF